MSVIRTAFPQSEVQSLDALRIDRLRLNPSDRDVTNLQIIRGGPVVAGINVLTADLLAALDATANTDVKHRARDEYRLKAVALDAERDEWKARAEKAEAELTEAKAALGRVEALSFGDNELIHASDLYAAIQPKPAFTLPTEPGAVIEATARDGSYCQFVTITGLSHPAYAMGESIYWAEDVLGCFTDHRLLGADQ